MRTLYLDEQTEELVIIDQTKLPNTLEYMRISCVKNLFDAIYTLALRGAPAIGVGAALGIYACAKHYDIIGDKEFKSKLLSDIDYIQTSRPTAKNLFYACGRLKKTIETKDTVCDILKSVYEEAKAIEKEDIDICHAIGKYGEQLLHDGCSVLTHCNAGSLCAVEYGTALAPIYEAANNGKKIHVYADETRPLLQGARLTCYELCKEGIDTTLICDNMAAGLMAKGKIDVVIVGCDRVASNGDFANKTGTLSVAVNCAYFGIPFYVAVPSSSIDRSISSGNEIVIEQRNGSEITDLFYLSRMAPENVKTYNPAFDVIPASLVTGYITEFGVKKEI